MAPPLLSNFPGRNALESALFYDLILKTYLDHEIKAHRMYVNVASGTIDGLCNEARRVVLRLA
jgi:hypothetical protein